MLKATVLIVSCNRKDELLAAVASARAQDFPHLDIVVYDDASSDGSLEAVRAQFPDVVAIGDGVKRSATVLRNLGFAKADGDVVFSLDDDSYFTSPDTVSRIMEVFAARPSVAVAAIPFIEPYFPSLHDATEEADIHSVSSYTGCAAAIRRSVFVDIGGYREFFEYYSEERDLSIRLMHAGYELVQVPTGLIVHTKSRKRNSRRQMQRALRNGYCAILLNVPARFVPGRIVRYTAGSLMYGFSFRTSVFKAWSLLCGFVDALSRLHARRAVSIETYRRFRSLPAHGRLSWKPGETPPRPCGLGNDFVQIRTRNE